jgi:hypothetical protein
VRKALLDDAAAQALAHLKSTITNGMSKKLALPTKAVLRNRVHSNAYHRAKNAVISQELGPEALQKKAGSLAGKLATDEFEHVLEAMGVFQDEPVDAGEDVD